MTNRKGGERYAQTESPFYRLKSKGKLAALLDLALSDLRDLASKSENYDIFDVGTEQKPRRVEHPKPLLKRVHSRLLELLRRIETPGYLHSGIRGRSYISNAAAHSGRCELATIDIRRFYPSTTTNAVFRVFLDQFKCSPDVSELITKLVTHQGHLPTGSPASQALAFYAHKEMFEELFQLSKDNGIRMTVYVDDITFSGERVPPRFLYSAKKIIHKYGLRYHKERRYSVDKPKRVTGVILSGSTTKLPNRRHQSIFKEGAQLFGGKTEGYSLAQLECLLGRCNAAGQLDPLFLPKARLVKRVLRKKLDGNGEAG